MYSDIFPTKEGLISLLCHTLTVHMGMCKVTVHLGIRTKCTINEAVFSFYGAEIVQLLLHFLLTSD